MPPKFVNEDILHPLAELTGGAHVQKLVMNLFRES